MLQPCKHARGLTRPTFWRKLSSHATRESANVTKSADKHQYDTAEPANDRDVFGTYSRSGRKSLQVQLADKSLPDDPDGYDKIEFDIVPRKNAYYYKYEIPKYALQGETGLRRALELFQEMKSRDRLEPTFSNFSTLIYGCARAGYTKRAFDLYEESLRYANRPSRSMVTSLINACGESPFQEYGLERLKWFLTHVKVEYNWQFNETQYNSAIKAYGKLGHLGEASKLIQEMLDNDIIPSVDTFNMLLIGCASDKESGCTFALRVFKRLKHFGFKPAVVTYRLLLRCIRDCEMGSPELVAETINELPTMTSFEQQLKYKKQEKRSTQKRKKFESNFIWAPLVTDMGQSIDTAVCNSKATRSTPKNPNKVEAILSDQCQVIEGGTTPIASSTIKRVDDGLVCTDNINQTLPNLLSDDHLNLIARIQSIDFNMLQNRAQRLMLFGGVQGFVEAMRKDGCQPDAKTMSLLLPCLSRKREDYLGYHSLVKNLNVQCDLSYYDQLIRDICEHGRFEGRLDLALYFIEQMQLDGLRPNISTFEAIAGGCQSWTKASRLLDNVQKCGFVVSPAMISKFVTRAKKSKNFRYLNSLIDYCRDIDFRPYKILVEELEDMRLRVCDLLLTQEKGTSERFAEIDAKEFDRFQRKLASWLKSVTLAPEDHPWAQFKVDTSSNRDGFRTYKEHFRAMEQLKEKSLKSGEALGNLARKAREMVQAAT